MRRPFWRSTLLPAFLALAVLNAAVLAAFTLPRSLRQKNAAARAAAARVELAQARERLATLRERAEAIRANRDDLERFYATQAGSERQDLLPTLEAIEKLARAPGLEPASRAVRRENVEGAPLERVAVTLPLAGTYEQLVGFLDGVERQPRFLTIDRVALRADADSGGSLQVELSAYLRRSPEARREGRRARQP